MPGSKGDLHTSPLLKSSGAKTCFQLDKPETLDQTDLEYLFKNKLTNLVIEVEVSTVVKSDKPTKTATTKTS